MSYKDPEVLRELYFGERLSTHEIAERLDVSQTTIITWMDKHDIDRRDRVEEVKRAVRRRPAYYGLNDSGYASWWSQDSEGGHQVRVHRLLAVAEHGVDGVAGMDVHHKNGIPWDNRPENIEVLSRAEHNAIHHSEGVACR